METKKGVFNIRVYGIWINENEEVLVSDEKIGPHYFTKFPGGGLEFGEGIKDCIIREWKEELDADIEVVQHLYTTDFFQISAFDNTSQIVSVYYQVKPLHTPPVKFATDKFDLDHSLYETESFRWIPLTAFSEEDVTLPIDKIVAVQVRERYNSK